MATANGMGAVATPHSLRMQMTAYGVQVAMKASTISQTMNVTVRSLFMRLALLELSVVCLLVC